MSAFASLIPAALYAFALLSDLERRNTDSWRIWNELQSSTARAGWPVEPTISPAHSHRHSRLVEVGISTAWVVWEFTEQPPVKSKASPGSKSCCLSPFQPSLTYKLLVGERSFAEHHIAEILPCGAAETVRAEINEQPELEDTKFFDMT